MAIAAVTPAMAADDVSMRAELSNGYARLILEAAQPLNATARIEEGVLVVSFDRPIALDPEAVENALAAYATQVRADANGEGLRVALRRTDYRTAASAADNRVAIDIVPPAYPGLPPALPPLPAPPTPPPPETDPDRMPVLKVRVGEHRDFSRVVFDFPELVDYSFSTEDGKLSILFDRPMRPDLERLNAAPPAWVRRANWAIEGTKLRITLTVDPAAGLHHFRDGPKIAFDIKAPIADAEGPPPAPVAPAAATPVPPSETVAATAEAEAVAAPTPEAESAPPASVGPPQATEAAPEAIAAVEQAAPPAPTPEPEAAAEAPVVAAASDADLPVVDAATGVPIEEHAEAPAAAPAPELPATDAAAAEAVAPVKRPPHVVIAASIPDGLSLTFPFPQPVGAAAFRRGPYLWLVFDGSALIDLSAIDQRFFSTVTQADQINVQEATVVRLTLAPTILASVAPAGEEWAVRLTETLAEPPAAITLTRQPRTVGEASVTATLTNASRVLSLTDPEAGDRVIVVTAMGPAQGLAAPRRFVEFQALGSAHGLAILPLTDDLDVSIEPAGVVISTGRGLTLSAGSVAQPTQTSSTVGPIEAPGFMDFTAWRGPPGQSFLDTRQALLRRSADPDADMTKARFDLARFYLAYGLAPEALGVLNLLEQGDRTSAQDPAFHAMRGLVYLLMGRYDEARGDLTGNALVNDPHAALWRALLAAETQDWGAVRRNLAFGESAIDRYPLEWQARLMIAAAKAALAVNDIESLDGLLSRMPQGDLPLPLRLEADLLRGQMMERLGRTADALEAYQAVAAADYRPLRVRATFAEIDLRSRTGSLGATQAIEQLDRLRFQWRGDDTELAILRRLAQLHIEVGDPRNGLSIMRAAVTNFPKSPLAREMRDEMGRIFETLFVGGTADKMPPVQALGLYYDFKELTPIGRLGDDMIRRLVDRLISVDLLAQAAELLQHQVDNRLQGVAKASVATRLAVVYLLDRKPEKALAAIHQSRQTLLPDTLARERRLLEARALSELRQYEAALDVVDGLEDSETTRLRADIYWAARNWPAAAAKLEALVTPLQAGSQPLERDARFNVIRAAIAYSLADDAAGLARLHAGFAAKMSASEDSRTFEVVSAPIDSQGVDFREFARQVASSDTLEAFMSGFRERFGVPAAGATN